ncbi:MAG TPA: OmpA family protein [Terriglobales bacterium]|nr:OmpA family protein [Terriglobales bacterium]
MKKSLVVLLLLGFSVPFAAQTTASPGTPAQSASSQSKVSRTSKAINFGRTGATKLSLHGTEAMPRANGELKIQSKNGRVEVDAKVNSLDQASRFGLEYLTYVLWAVSPQGRADNLGELILDDHGSSKLKATTELQTFGLLVTAEPYFAVTQPSSLVVLENEALPGSGREQQIEFSYQLLGRDAYSSSNQRIDNAIFGIDPNTPLELFEARNAVRIARAANAEKYAGPVLAKAEQSLQQAETAYRQKHNNKAGIESFARDAAQNAEDARVMALKKQEEERLAKEAADREAKAKAQAEAEAARAKQAEEDRAKAEAARAEAERLKQEAEAEAREAAKAKAEAEQARAAAVAQQQALAAEADKARQAAQEADRLREQAEKEKADLRARLLQQLNAVLETHDSARGLISNMGDVLFQTGKFELKPEARERLAKVSGILLAYPTLKIAIEGHTDSVGTDDYNQRLSEQRAEAVRDYFVQQGVSADSVTAQGFGKTQPIAANDTPEGRQRNRRVELVLSGDAIGTSASTPAPKGPQVRNAAQQTTEQ